MVMNTKDYDKKVQELLAVPGYQPIFVDIQEAYKKSNS